MTLHRDIGDGLSDGADIAHRHLFLQQGLQHFEQGRQGNHPRHQLLGQLGRALGQQLHQLLHFFVTEQLVGMLVQHLVEVGSDHGAGVHHGVAERLRLITLSRVDPHRLQTKCRVFGGDTVKRAEHLTGVDRQFAIRIHLGLGHADAH